MSLSAPSPALPDPTLADPARIHRARLAAAKAHLAALDSRSAAIANGRTVAFLGAAALAALWYFGKLPPWSGAASIASGLGFVALAIWHQRVFTLEERGRAHATLSERGLARLFGGWRAFKENGEGFVNTSHLYSSDLDIFGQGSLFQLINECATDAGERRLAAMLSSASEVATARARQAAVGELSKAIDFREDLAVEGRLATRGKPNPAPFIAWAEGGARLDSIRWARPLAWLLPLTTLALFVLRQYRIVPPQAWWLGVAATVAVAAITRGALQAFWNELSAGDMAMARFERLFALTAAARFTDPTLRKLTGDGAPARALAAFSRAFAFADLRRTQLHPPVQLLTLWDVHWFFRLERWRSQHGATIRGAFEALAELEALCALATLAHDRPGYVFPTLDDSGPSFAARQLGHPLLDRPVCNDAALPGAGHALLVTGSNMSGKTTLVRAMGLNAVLALAGAPVCAAELSLSHVRVLTSMRVQDSLERGVSFFHAEVQRLKKVLDAAQAASGQALFLLDEILLGTNTRERQIASRVVLKRLLATGSIGAVTTHDLSLAELEPETGGKVKNVHFRDLLEGGEMTFDYRLQPGVVSTTNALRVLAQAGIPIDLDGPASPETPETR